MNPPPVRRLTGVDPLADALGADGALPPLGPYTILEKLGEGGMGWVYKARHEKLGRLVALKIVRPDCLTHQSIVDRFQQEARLAAQLQHPNIVAIYDANEAEGVHFIAMEYVAGIDLAKLVRQEGPRPAEQACEYIRQAAIGLQHAFERGLVHRDIKPSNLMIVQDSAPDRPLVKVLDFGLARLTDEETDAAPLTQTGDCIGTPDFIAPEQALDSKRADTRADIFSLGCSLYYLLTGKCAFAGRSPEERLANRLSANAFALRLPHPGIPSPVEAVLATMLAHNPADRFQTPIEVARALEACSRDSRLEAKAQPSGPTGALESSGRAAPTSKGSEQATPDLTPDRSSPLYVQATQTYAGAPSKRWRLWRSLAVAACVALALSCWWFALPRLPPADTDQVLEPPTKAPVVNSIGMTLVRIPRGTFLMGSPASETERGEDEGPQHRVQFSRPFYLGAYEVTQSEYFQVMKKNPSYFSAEGGGKREVRNQDTGRFPVETVSWEEAVIYCRKLSELADEQTAGRRYRLPTEAEWEYACRAGASGPFSFGDALSSALANVAGNRPYGGAAADVMRPHTTAVGTFPANEFGVFDMHGNVWEWCHDAYGPYSAADQVDPRGPPSGTEKILRGGGYGFAAADCRSASRTARNLAARNSFYGFRVLCEAE